MRSAYGGLGMMPDVLWQLSPADLCHMLEARAWLSGPARAEPMARAQFEQLKEDLCKTMHLAGC